MTPVEAVESAFNEVDALGTEADGLMKKPDEPVCVTGFFDNAQEEQDLLQPDYVQEHTP